MPTAQRGVLDLSGWDLERDGPVRLDGEWEVHWNRLLDPAGFSAISSPVPEHLTVPGSWSQAKPSSGLMPFTGQATLRLVVRLGTAPRLTALRLANINSAYIVWVNGRLVAQSGSPGVDAASEAPRPSALVVPLHQGNLTQNRAETLELVLQISNHNYRDGGVLTSLLYGQEDTLLAREQVNAGISMFLAGALLCLGVYHLGLYFFRRSDNSPMLFGVYCLLSFCFYVCTISSDWAVRILLKDSSATGLERFGLACFFLSVPVGFTFFRSLYPREFSRSVQIYALLAGATFTLVAAFASPLALDMALPLYYLSSIAMILYASVQLLRAWLIGRTGAPFIFAGFLVLGLTGINDMLLDLRLIRSTPLLAPGLLVFILSQSFALSQRLSRAFTAVEHLSAQLEHKNLSLEAEMIERNRLEREVISISEGERRRMSQDLHDGLCQLLTAARLRCAAIAHIRKGKAGAMELEPLSNILDELVDQAYDLSHGLWPLEHASAFAGPSLHNMIRRFSRSSGVPIEFRQEIACETCLNADVTQLYRIAQEALANAVKHAKPTRIFVTLLCRADATVLLEVRDNGIGRAKAAASASGLGTGIMAHRARMIGGELNIADAEGGGTTVACIIPCERHQPAAAARRSQ
ncbi:MAG: histidine kinase [Deltaproteobacteria bacterium HGW-Deltaproteobacteria-8]|jgi:signal transduction histidine kinase|nr:MAG: histidine kinase [Deltaproteobacteria bacterium HGW-Deltaproteobacteria-8]